MNFNPNLSFAEIFYRYSIMMAVGIAIGILRIYWAVPFMMLIFMTALMGYCPVKEAIVKRRERLVNRKNINTTTPQALQHTTLHA